MGYKPCRERMFPLNLAAEFKRIYDGYLYWLRQLVERLGRERTFTLWQDAINNYDDTLLQGILSAGWNKEVSEGKIEDIDNHIAGVLTNVFPSTIDGVSKEEARELIEKTPPIPQIRKRFPSLDVWKPITTYDALHIAYDGLALIVESMIKHQGKEGEYIAYDLITKWHSCQAPRESFDEFIAAMAAFPKACTADNPEADCFTAGLEIEMIRESKDEVVYHIKECEWSRYFLEHHPQVGPLMMCGVDDSEFRAHNDKVRFQRTSTIMEGAKVCAFRLYAIEEPAPKPSPYVPQRR